ncbi:MAG TPA: asparagine synthase (glutamine-hydrolyzing) [Vicinamibacteria bacterium]|nr:asparagine synthase (glutamine-hydrolyzing) [Vicinamibacteria bacterium]
MCGIAGILNPGGKPVDPADLRRMAAALAHRGPDDEGFLIDGSFGLAHRRLAILDLSPAGRQPLTNEDGTVAVAYNGQLYGFGGVRSWLETRGHRFRSRTDTEVLVHLYEEKGDDLVLDIDGMFAFALWDSRRRHLLLVRDRLGIKPLYFAWHQGALAFASEIGALLALPWLPRRVDPVGLAHFLYQSSVPDDACILAGCRKLGPGERMSVRDEVATTSRYWVPPQTAEDEGYSLEAAGDELRERLTAAVSSHLVADVPVGTFLSGGLDSTGVAQSLVRLRQGPAETFTIRFPDAARADEGPAARQVANALGTLHHELVLAPEDLLASLPTLMRLAGEPFAISSSLALCRLAAFARERVKVVLTGDGADEILAGYPWRHQPELGAGASAGALIRGLALTGVRSLRGARSGGPGLLAQLAHRLRRQVFHPAERYAELVSAFTPQELLSLLQPAWHPAAEAAWALNPVRRGFDAALGASPVNRRLRADLVSSLPGEMLTKVDRMTMGAGLEARVPFLDRGFVEWALRLPGRLKIRGGIGKLVLRRALERNLPEAARRPKHGFNVPLGPWLRGPLRPLLDQHLGPDTVRTRGIFRPQAVDRLIRAHSEGRGDYSRQLFTLLMLELWLAEGPGRESALDPALR